MSHSAHKKIRAEKYVHIKFFVTFHILLHLQIQRKRTRFFLGQFQNHTFTQRHNERNECNQLKKSAPKRIRINSNDNRRRKKIMCSNPSKTKYESNDNIIPYINGYVKIHIICRWNETYNKLIEYYVGRFVWIRTHARTLHLVQNLYTFAIIIGKHERREWKHTETNKKK